MPVAKRGRKKQHLNNIIAQTAQRKRRGTKDPATSKLGNDGNRWWSLSRDKLRQQLHQWQEQSINTMNQQHDIEEHCHGRRKLNHDERMTYVKTYHRREKQQWSPVMTNCLVAWPLESQHWYFPRARSSMSIKCYMNERQSRNSNRGTTNAGSIKTTFEFWREIFGDRILYTTTGGKNRHGHFDAPPSTSGV